MSSAAVMIGTLRVNISNFSIKAYFVMFPLNRPNCCLSVALPCHCSFYCEILGFYSQNSFGEGPHDFMENEWKLPENYILLPQLA